MTDTPIKTWTVLQGLLAFHHQTDPSLSASVIKDIYHTEPWIVLQGWPIEPMARWIQWVTSSWNIGTDWPPIVIICQCFRLSHNRPRWWVLPMYRSSSSNYQYANTDMLQNVCMSVFNDRNWSEVKPLHQFNFYLHYDSFLLSGGQLG